MTTVSSATTATAYHYFVCFVPLLFLALHTSPAQSFSILPITSDGNTRHYLPTIPGTTRHSPSLRTKNVIHQSNKEEQAISHNNVHWQPSRIEISNLSHQYPETLWRKLTSSEPRRPYSVQDLSLTFGQEFTLLLGDSSSGKSTLLKLILGLETPVAGSIEISSHGESDMAPAVPILLELQPVYSNRPQTVEAILQEKLKQLKSSIQENGQLMDNAFLKDLCDTLGLSLDKRGSDLSPSEVYCCAMAEASIESMMMMRPSERDEFQTMDYTSLSAPILFLDEWMDKETSTVVQKVQSSILKLVDRGAIVVSITHYPNLYKKQSAIEETGERNSVRTITLRRGKMV